MARGLVTAALLAAALAVTGTTVGHAAPAVDRLRAVNIVPPGESGLVTIPGFVTGTTGIDPTYGPHVQDQLPLYRDWRYKPFALEPALTGTPVPGDPAVTVARDRDGVPVITAASEVDLADGIGYAMAQDRLFQMELFRRVGHGTLAELVGPSKLPMDEAVRRASEGPAARAAELAAQPHPVRDRLHAFTTGINAAIAEAISDPTRLPAELVLLNDLPLASWTDDDTIAFGEYAGRFFGQFGGAELTAARAYVDLVAQRGQPVGEAAFGDLFPLDDPSAPASIAPADGTFPRHTTAPVSPGAGGSPFANHDPSIFGSAAVVAGDEQQLNRNQAAVRQIQRTTGIPLLGSNEVIVSGRLTASGDPMLYGGPQTGFSIPGYFWEAELHDPQRDMRGVMVPGIPLVVIGRTADTAFTVTSGLDANSDLVVEQLDAANQTYRHNGQVLTVQATHETIPCREPPTAATGLLAGLTAAQPGLPQTCPVGGDPITEYRTVHGAAVLDPDSEHHLYVVQSAVDGNLISSLLAWDGVGMAHDPAALMATLAPMALCFNFAFVDASGNIAYVHTGHLPLRPSNADPNLPLPGDGRFDWQGFERFADLPHVVNPSTGYLVNWNNKPAVGWWSKSTKQESAAANIWSSGHQVEALDAAVRAGAPFTLDTFAVVARGPAYVDNPARLLRPALLAALAGTDDRRLAQLRDILAAWDLQRLDAGNGRYPTAAVVIFDRFLEHLLLDTVGRLTGVADARILAGMRTDCGGPDGCHLVSHDNLDTPTMKWELASDHLVLNAVSGRTTAPWLGAGGAPGALTAALTEAADELTAAQGADPTAWNEPVETTDFNANALGAAGVVSEISPLPNRGSYGQAVEALVSAPAAATGTGTAAPAAGLPTTAIPNTGAAIAGATASAAALLGAAALAAAGRRRRSRRSASR